MFTPGSVMLVTHVTRKTIGCKFKNGVTDLLGVKNENPYKIRVCDTCDATIPIPAYIEIVRYI